MAETEKGLLQPKTFSFEWTIERFFADCEKVADFHRSPVYPVHYSNQVTKWHLQVYPKGFNEENKDYVSIFLRFQSENVSQVVADYQLSIIGKKNNLYQVGKASIFNKNQPSNWGWRNFVKQDILKDMGRGVLIDDKLTITCKVTFNPETKTFDVYSEWLDTMPKGFDEYESLIETNSFSDVTFNIQDKKIHLHKDILMCRNLVFKAMFEHDMKEKEPNEVEITDVDYDVMKELFRFIYSSKVENIEKIAKDLLIAADKYGVTQLKALCEKTLYDNLTEDNAIEYLKLTDMCDTLHLKKLVIKFVVANLTKIVRKSDFKLLFADLAREVVCEIMEAIAQAAVV